MLPALKYVRMCLAFFYFHYFVVCLPTVFIDTRFVPYTFLASLERCDEGTFDHRKSWAWYIRGLTPPSELYLFRGSCYLLI